MNVWKAVFLVGVAVACAFFIQGCAAGNAEPVSNVQPAPASADSDKINCREVQEPMGPVLMWECPAFDLMVSLAEPLPLATLSDVLSAGGLDITESVLMVGDSLRPALRIEKQRSDGGIQISWAAIVVVDGAERNVTCYLRPPRTEEKVCAQVLSQLSSGQLRLKAIQVNGGEPAIDESSLRALLEARDLESLDRVFSKAAREDEALKAIYHARRIALNDSREEELRFLEALPATAKGLWRVYQLTYLSESKPREDPRISDIVYSMFERAARYARRYGSGHRRVLQLCLFSDGDLAETAWEWCDWLLLHDSERTLAAIRSLPIEDQRRMCLGETAEGLTVEDAVRKCATGI